MKSALIISVIFIYCISMSLSLHYVGNNIVDRHIIGLLTHAPMLFMIGFVLILRNFTLNNSMHKELYLIADFMILSFLCLYCLNNMGLVSGVTKKLLAFNGLNVVFILIVLTNGFRHGIFKRK